MEPKLRPDAPAMSPRCPAGATTSSNPRGRKRKERRQPPVLPSVNSVRVSRDALSLFTRYLTACQASPVVLPSLGDGKLHRSTSPQPRLRASQKPESHCFALLVVPGRIQGPDLVAINWFVRVTTGMSLPCRKGYFSGLFGGGVGFGGGWVGLSGGAMSQMAKWRITREGFEKLDALLCDWSF